MRLSRLAAVTTLTAALALTGCGDDEPSPDDVPGADESGILDDVPDDDSTLLAPTAEADAEADVSRGRLPDGFPDDEVPLVDERLLGGAVTTAAGGVEQYTVSFGPDDADRAHDDAVALLTDAGYASTGSDTQGPSRVSRLDNGTWQVSVATSPAGLVYVVTPSE